MNTRREAVARWGRGLAVISLSSNSRVRADKARRVGLAPASRLDPAIYPEGHATLTYVANDRQPLGFRYQYGIREAASDPARLFLTPGFETDDIVEAHRMRKADTVRGKSVAVKQEARTI